MPVHKASGGYKWGNTEKVYLTKAQAKAQAGVQSRAIYALGYKEKPTNKKK